MAVRRYTITMENATIGSQNQAVLGFTFNNSETDANNAAAAILYIASASAQMMAGGSSVVGVSMRAAGSLGALELPFPDPEYSDLQTALAGPHVSTTTMTDYGVSIGGGSLAAVGTSVCVTERTATLGRTGIGRHFLPFVTSACITAAGLFNSTNAANVAASYHDVFADGGFDPCVCPANLTAPKPVTLVQPLAILSNLRTRRR